MKIILNIQTEVVTEVPVRHQTDQLNLKVLSRKYKHFVFNQYLSVVLR